jgi:hypothetical protein
LTLSKENDFSINFLLKGLLRWRSFLSGFAFSSAAGILSFAEDAPAGILSLAGDVTAEIPRYEMVRANEPLCATAGATVACIFDVASELGFIPHGVQSPDD